MATKTITLEIDACERLRAAKRHGESFSQVVRRAVCLTSRRRRVSGIYPESVAEWAEYDSPPDDPWT